MTTEEKTDALAKLLNEHIWYTTTSLAGRSPHVKCKCTLELADSVDHSKHVALIALIFMEDA